MKTEWEYRISQFWKSADGSKIEETLAAMKALVNELEPTNPLALFEWASVHDFLGLESEAIPIYREALDSGLDGVKREMAVIQLASSLRNIGKPLEAILLLEETTFSATTAQASRAFLAFAHFDAGNQSKSLTIAMAYSYPTDGLYASSIKFYAGELANTER